MLTPMDCAGNSASISSSDGVPGPSESVIGSWCKFVNVEVEDDDNNKVS